MIRNFSINQMSGEIYRNVRYIEEVAVTSFKAATTDRLERDSENYIFMRCVACKRIKHLCCLFLSNTIGQSFTLFFSVMPSFVSHICLHFDEIEFFML